MTLISMVKNEWDSAEKVITMKNFLDGFKRKNNLKTYDSTILRAIRKLRERREIDYVVTDRKRSIYVKIM